MTKEITTIDVHNVRDVLNEIDDAFYDIPFENSNYQNEYFVVASQLTPERAYRSIGLKMHSKIRALNEAKYARLKEDIDIAELREKIANEDTSKWDKQRYELDIQQKLENRPFTDKLIHDALEELNFLYALLKKFPKYTREQFEQGEDRHFSVRLTRQMEGKTGPRESLLNMTNDMDELMEELTRQVNSGNYLNFAEVNELA